MSEPMQIWWRDDDAGRDTERLGLLLDLSRRTRRPLALAVVPAWLRPEVVAEIRACESVFVLQHGWDHADHAPAGKKRIELGGTLSAEACRDRLARGKNILEQAFGERFLPVLVPPWNRIDDHCLATLGPLGFAAVSTFADDARALDYGLGQINAHVDLIDWRGGRRMKPPAMLRAEIDRLSTNPALGTLGLLSHHLDMTPADITALEQLFRHIDGLDQCRWASLRQLFQPPRKPTHVPSRRCS